MIVLDTSAALAALTGSAVARDAITGRRLVAPHLIDVEMAHALRGLVLAGKVTSTDADAVLGAWLSLAIDRVPVTRWLGRIFELRDNLTAYDAAFVVTAESLGVPLLTADRRMSSAPGPRCSFEFLPL